MTAALTEVRISRKGADRVRSGHPWIFSSDVTERSGAAAGDAVTVTDHRRRPLGVAHYSSTSQICLRMLSDRVEPIDASFFERRLTAAEAHRRTVVRDSDAYRLVHAEGDLLPALIVDSYGDYLVAQTLDQGMDRAKETILAELQRLLPVKGIVLRNDAAVRRKESCRSKRRSPVARFHRLLPSR